MGASGLEHRKVREHERDYEHRGESESQNGLPHREVKEKTVRDLDHRAGDRTGAIMIVARRA
jgi:hypothetical protein